MKTKKEKKEKIYISGKITGRKLYVAESHFRQIEESLQSRGYRTCNPLRMRLPRWLATHGCYRLCLLIELVWMAYTCDGIYMLRGWLKSGGAKAEQNLANALGLKIMYQSAEGKEKEKEKKGP